MAEVFEPDPSGDVNRDPDNMTFGAATGGAGGPGPQGPAGANGASGSSGPLWVSAAAMISSTTNGATAGTRETTTNKRMIDYYAFDSATSQGVEFLVVMPSQWNLGTITATFYWEQASTGAGGVTWGIAGVAVTDAGSEDVAQGTEVTVDDTAPAAASTLMITAATGAVTVGGTPADGKLVFFKIQRKTAAANDTLAEAARLIGCRITYTNA